MSTAQGRLITLSLLFIVSAISWWLAGHLTTKEQVKLIASEQRADYVIENFSTTVMDANGEKKYILNADKLEHYPDTDESYLISPYLIQFTDNNQPVYTRAEKGLLTNNNKQIVMTENVTITRPHPGTESSSVMTTETLEIILD